MPLSPAADVTGLLHAWQAGDAAALDRLVPLVYGELRRVARARLRGQRPDFTLQTTALVHEVYLRLVQAGDCNWQNRTHFFALCARAMRQILVNVALARRAAKRGGAMARVALDDNLAAVQAPAVDILALDEALTQLAGEWPRAARVVELRYFTGLSTEDTAAALGVSAPTVHRDWQFARLWLARALRHADANRGTRGAGHGADRGGPRRRTRSEGRDDA
jgi:RNA polymerase sigma factor (TIGR02999 family)